MKNIVLSVIYYRFNIYLTTYKTNVVQQEPKPSDLLQQVAKEHLLYWSHFQ